MGYGMQTQKIWGAGYCGLLKAECGFIIKILGQVLQQQRHTMGEIDLACLLH
jgi:hypothetical protein